jgi:chloramphenicol-sensitive protein RarD
MLFGLLILGERLNPTQATAVAIAAVGVATLTLRVGELPWISLALATSFALYGLIHKLHPQPPIAGLAREMLVLTPLALIAVVVLASRADSALLEATPAMQAYLSLSSVITAIPLLLFHAATRRLPLVAVGMFQYIAPTMTLLIATLGYDEPFSSAQATGFGFVWLGLAVFTIDSVRRARSNRLVTPIDPWRDRA